MATMGSFHPAGRLHQKFEKGKQRRHRKLMLGLLTGLLGGKGGALKTISSVIDDLHTSEEEKLDKKILMQRIKQKLAEKQIDVNIKEGQHKSIFVAGWRPMIGWTGAFALIFEFIVSPGIEWYAKFSGLDITAPDIQTGPLLAIVTSMLGVAGLRSFEKTKGLTK